MPELSAFEGIWDITREITDHKAGQTVRFEGEARFAPIDAKTLAYEETGQMLMPNQPPMQASRRYTWVAASNGIDVFFEDGRFFHHFGGEEAPQAHHDCPPDVYDVSYSFGDWPRWQAVWRVTGPRKDYQMVSVYRYRSGI